MKKIILSLVLIGLVVAITGCEEKTHTVSYYRKHQKEAREKVAWCIKQDKLTKTQREECGRADLGVESDISDISDRLKSGKNPTMDEIINMFEGKKSSKTK